MTIFEKLNNGLKEERTVYLYDFKNSILIRDGFHTYIKLSTLNEEQITMSVTNLREGLYYDIFKKQYSERVEDLVGKVKKIVVDNGFKVLDLYKKV